MDKFIPVKIINQRRAEELLDGKVFMRPLYEFGSWNINKDATVNNSFRGDLYEGTTQVFSEINDFEDVKGFSEDFKKYAKNITLIDNEEIKYFKIFSLYCMKYIPHMNSFEKPDARMAAFGDTAVVISNFNEFLDRFAKALFNKYECVCSMMDVVEYYDYSTTRQVNPLFEKRNGDSYQNELRIAWCELEENRFARGQGAEQAMCLVESLDRVTLDIGDIRDIAFQIPIDDFLDLKFPENTKLYFPMREANEIPSNFDNIIKWTRDCMAQWQQISSKMICTI